MPNLNDLVHVKLPDAESGLEPEDIFLSASSILFPDHISVSHGDENSTIVYKSVRFGDIELKTAAPVLDAERQLFSHYLWNAGIKMAELISNEVGHWNVQNEKVLELGAGVGLVGLVSAHAGATQVRVSRRDTITNAFVDLGHHADRRPLQICITDYPSITIMNNIRRNIAHNLGSRPEMTEVLKRCSIVGHEWGDDTSEFATQNRHCFTRIIATDCMWLPQEHRNLARSMVNFLSRDPDGRVLFTAGFHTGRAKLARFFNVAVEEGLEVEEIYEEHASGSKRPWLPERDGGREDVTARNWWLLVGRLRLSSGSSST